MRALRYGLPLLGALSLLSGCDRPSADPSPAQPKSSANSEGTALPRARKVGVAALGPDELRNNVRAAGWNVSGDLDTEFGSCKELQLDLKKGPLEGRIELYDCRDEYDAERRETSAKAAEAAVERAGGRMVVAIVGKQKAEAERLLGATLGR